MNSMSAQMCWKAVAGVIKPSPPAVKAAGFALGSLPPILAEPCVGISSSTQIGVQTVGISTGLELKLK
jgi:hypothetical protein